MIVILLYFPQSIGQDNRAGGDVHSIMRRFSAAENLGNLDDGKCGGSACISDVF